MKSLIFRKRITYIPRETKAMPSTNELIFFFISFILLIIVQHFDEKLRKKDTKRRSSSNALSETRYKESIYWFRDYWSNRRQLGRTRKPEGIGWNDKEEFNIDLLGPEELKTNKDTKGFLSIKDVRGESLLKGVVDPTILIKKFEPKNTEVVDDIGFFDNITSEANLASLANSLSREKGKLNALQKRFRLHETSPPLPPEDVFTEPMTQMKGRFPITFALISIGIIWFISILLRVLIGFFPILEVIFWPALVLSIVLWGGLIGVSTVAIATRKLKEASAFIQIYDGKNSKFHYQYKQDVPSWLGLKPYWVFSYIFNWSGEFTFKKCLPVIKRDLERIEVWVDAKKGTMEWIVTDYHYRELWFKAAPDQSSINVLTFPNFHTLIPLNIVIKDRQELKDMFDGKTPMYKKWYNFQKKCRDAHMDDWIASEIGRGFVTTQITSILHFLWWDYWRYPKGADSKEYIDSKEPPVVGEQPIGRV